MADMVWVRYVGVCQHGVDEREQSKGMLGVCCVIIRIMEKRVAITM